MQLHIMRPWDTGCAQAGEAGLDVAMAVSVYAAAKCMGQESDWSLSNLEMQKLLYIAHMFHLGQCDGEPLVSGNFEAWDYGPVHPTLYHKVKIFGSLPVKASIFQSTGSLTDAGLGRQLIVDAVRYLAKSKPGKLVAITHWKEGAWAKNYIPGARNITIPNDDIIEEYKRRVSRSRQNG